MNPIHFQFVPFIIHLGGCDGMDMWLSFVQCHILDFSSRHMIESRMAICGRRDWLTYIPRYHNLNAQSTGYSPIPVHGSWFRPNCSTVLVMWKIMMGVSCSTTLCQPILLTTNTEMTPARRQSWCRWWKHSQHPEIGLGYLVTQHCPALLGQYKIHYRKRELPIFNPKATNTK